MICTTSLPFLHFPPPTLPLECTKKDTIQAVDTAVSLDTSAVNAEINFRTGQWYPNLMFLLKVCWER